MHRVTRLTQSLAIAVIVGICLANGSFATAPREDGVLVAADGQPRAVIVVAARGRGDDKLLRMAEEHAAAALCGNLRQATGADIQVVEERKLPKVRVEQGRIIPAAGTTTGENFILVGEGPLARQLGVTSEGLKPGGIRIKTLPNAVVLVGHPTLANEQDAGGIRRAITVFLEKLGFRCLWPGEMGKVVPDLRTLRVAAIDLSYSPVIGQRGMRFQGADGRAAVLQRLGFAEAPKTDVGKTRAGELAPALHYGRGDLSWKQWHGQGGDLGYAGGHAGSGLAGGWKEHGQAHPEWFALQADGTRDHSANARFQICPSNPQLVEHVAADLIARLEKNPGIRSFSLSPNDGGYCSFCLCDACKALDPPNAPPVRLTIYEKVGRPERRYVPHVSLTDRYVHYWNAIAERVTKVHPNVLFTVDSYSVYLHAPVREKVHPNLVVRYVSGSDAEWAKWRQAGARHLVWRPNILLSGWKNPVLSVFPTRLAETMHSLTEGGCEATDLCAVIGHWATCGLNYYAAARLNWEPHVTADQILDEYCSPGFGAGAEAVKRYFKTAEQALAAGPRSLDAAKLSELAACLDEAERAAAGDSAAVERIRFLRLGLAYTDLQMQIGTLVKQAEEKDSALDRTRSRRLVAANYLLLRDFMMHHPLAVSGDVIYRSGDFAEWAPIGGRGYRASESLLKQVEAAGLTLSGREKGADEILAAFRIERCDPSLLAPGAQPKAGRTILDADENGEAFERPAD